MGSEQEDNKKKEPREENKDTLWMRMVMIGLVVMVVFRMLLTILTYSGYANIIN